ncbi:MAG TPA: hypothetical protein VH393_13660 [Ktedonobacterales bacterium]|jgi:hypothetical protein
MSRLGRLFRSRITLALLGMALVGGGGAYWAVTSGAPSTPQASSSLSNQDPTSTASVDDPAETATTDPGATATTPPTRPTSTPRPTATPCVATPTPTGQPPQWHGSIASVGATSFVLRVGCGRPTITADVDTTWPGQAKQIADLHPGWLATVVLKTQQPNGSYLAASVNAQRDN